MPELYDRSCEYLLHALARDIRDNARDVIFISTLFRTCFQLYRFDI